MQRGGSQHKDLKPEAVGVSGLCQMPLTAFSVRGNRMLPCMEICKELRYNFGVGSDRQIVKSEFADDFLELSLFFRAF